MVLPAFLGRTAIFRALRLSEILLEALRQTTAVVVLPFVRCPVLLVFVRRLSSRP